MLFYTTMFTKDNTGSRGFIRSTTTYVCISYATSRDTTGDNASIVALLDARGHTDMTLIV